MKRSKHKLNRQPKAQHGPLTPRRRLEVANQALAERIVADEDQTQAMLDWQTVIQASEKGDSNHYSVEPEANEAMDRLARRGLLVVNPNGTYAVTEKGKASLAQMREAIDKMSGLARTVLEQPELAGALTQEEKLALFRSGHSEAISEDMALDYKAKLAEAEKQNHFCSVCGIEFEGIGHSAAPFPGRCCKDCADSKVLPARVARMERGRDPRRIDGDRFHVGLGGAPLPVEMIAKAAISTEEETAKVGLAPGGPMVDIHGMRGERFQARDAGPLLEMAQAAGAAPEAASLGVTSKGRFGEKFEDLRHGNQIVRPNWRGPGPDEIPSMKELADGNLLPEGVAASVEKFISELRPDLMRKFYPRIYQDVGRYHSPRQCAAFLANVVAEMERIGREAAPTAYQLLMPILEPMSKRGMPAFFIAPDLLKAILLTDFLGDIDWTTLNLPYEQGMFILPKGALVNEVDGDVSMILWGRFQKGQTYAAPSPRIGPVILGNLGFTLIGLTHANGVWYDSTFNAEVRPTVQLHNLFYRETGERTPPALKTTRLDSDLTETDEEFLEKLGVVAFGTFLAMNAKPELMEQGKLLKRVQAKAGNAREFWSPNVIGPRYRLKREVPRIDRHGKFTADQARRAQGGTHASPRLHWRRGHFRNQPYGVGLRERKQIWIEPCLIGAETEEAKGAGGGGR
jgi:hypothetical protein